MINLLPRGKKNQLKKEYRLRTLFVFGILIAFIILSLGVVFSSFYYLLIAEGAQLEETLVMREGSSAQQENQRILEDLSTKLFVMTRPDESAIVSELVKRLIDLKNDGITITEINYTSGASEIVKLEGRATTRENFVSFLTNIEEVALFGEVDSPISNLSKSENILYTLTITLTP